MVFDFVWINMRQAVKLVNNYSDWKQADCITIINVKEKKLM